MSPKDLELATGMTNGNIRQLLFWMTKDNEVQKVGRGQYAHPDKLIGNGADGGYPRQRRGDILAPELDDVDFESHYSN